jgi:hypothetical protein
MHILYTFLFCKMELHPSLSNLRVNLWAHLYAVEINHTGLFGALASIVWGAAQYYH